ncbi:MAG: HAD family hydrolase [Candidatus Woesearchaeota archaeon]
MVKIILKKAIFLDRDGVINKDYGYVNKIKDFELYPNVIKALKLLQKKYSLFIVTNQSGIGRGYYTLKDFKNLNNHMLTLFKKNGINIIEVYYCIHSPEEKCKCRKPSTHFIKQAKDKYSLDIKNSYVIGDKPEDIEMGHNIGTKTVLVLTGQGKKYLNKLNIQPDYIAKNLYDAAVWINIKF